MEEVKVDGIQMGVSGTQTQNWLVFNSEHWLGCEFHGASLRAPSLPLVKP